jgi:DNA mismatch endonuclease (patch repair protein)
MARIRSRDTKPELFVRRLVHAMGYRYRLHGKGLPGRPDLVFSGRRKVIFVHGCFWHGHTCKRAQLPSSNVAFWEGKIAGNKRRDARTKRLLRAQGWKILTVWQCILKDTEKLERDLNGFLENGSPKVQNEVF